jgi:ribonuclease J
MNIITNKEVFSDENQAKMPKKVERRRPMRPRKNTSGTPSQTRPEGPSQATPAAQPSNETPSNTQPQPAAGEAPKTVFYQAARPRPGQQPARPATPPTSGAAFTNSVNRPAQSQPQNPGQRPQGARPQFPRSNNRPPFRRPMNDGQAFQPFTNPTPQQMPAARSNLNVRIIPLGGLEEIGKNMTLLEYGNDIIIVDMGFMFPDSEMLGVDYIIPDVSYLDDKKDKIRGAVITHGHLDHIGAIPYLIERVGFPTMYGTPVTMGLVKQRLEEFNLIGRNKLVNIEPDKDIIQLGAFKVRPFHLVHSVPGAIGLEIETPNGRMVYATDWKFDYTPADNKPVDLRNLAAIGSRGVDLIFSDSTNAEKPGTSVSERVVEASLAASIEEAKGRVVVAMFASNLNRIQQTINAASRNGRKVLIQGRSLQQNVEMGVNLKAIAFPPSTLISEREVNRFTDDKLLVISTGAQGEERSALTRMANGEHKTIKIKKGDTVILSSSPIPGNEKSVNGLMDSLYKAGASVIYNKMLDVHTTGHATQEDLKLMLALMHPKFFIPLHGERSKRIVHGRLAQEVGIPTESVMIADNGSVLLMDANGKVSISDENVPAGYVIVDGLGIGDVGNIVLADRKAMAQEGIFVVITVFDSKSKKFITSPDIISRGFIYMRENEKFINDVRNDIKRFLNEAIEGKQVDLNAIKAELRDYLNKALYQKTQREPMVIPVIIEL